MVMVTSSQSQKSGSSVSEMIRRFRNSEPTSRRERDLSRYNGSAPWKMFYDEQAIRSRYSALGASLCPLDPAEPKVSIVKLADQIRSCPEGRKPRLSIGKIDQKGQAISCNEAFPLIPEQHSSNDEAAKVSHEGDIEDRPCEGDDVDVSYFTLGTA